MRVGVLALQGDFALHGKALARCGVEAVEVRKPEALEEVDGLVVPGGESTTLLRLIEAWGFAPALERFHAAEKPLFGTCAGLILLARRILTQDDFAPSTVDLADVVYMPLLFEAQLVDVKAEGALNVGDEEHGPRVPMMSNSLADG